MVNQYEKIELIRTLVESKETMSIEEILEILRKDFRRDYGRKMISSLKFLKEKKFENVINILNTIIKEKKNGSAALSDIKILFERGEAFEVSEAELNRLEETEKHSLLNFLEERSQKIGERLGPAIEFNDLFILLLEDLIVRVGKLMDEE